MANKEDQCKGTFWEARYKSIAILDEEALLTTLAYVELNPLAAGMAKTPEASPHTSVKARVEDCRERGVIVEVVDQPIDRTSIERVQTRWRLKPDSGRVPRPSSASGAQTWWSLITAGRRVDHPADFRHAGRPSEKLGYGCQQRQNDDAKRTRGTS